MLLSYFAHGYKLFIYKASDHVKTNCTGYLINLRLRNSLSHSTFYVCEYCQFAKPVYAMSV